MMKVKDGVKSGGRCSSLQSMKRVLEVGVEVGMGTSRMNQLVGILSDFRSLDRRASASLVKI